MENKEELNGEKFASAESDLVVHVEQRLRHPVSAGFTASKMEALRGEVSVANARLMWLREKG